MKQYSQYVVPSYPSYEYLCILHLENQLHTRLKSEAVPQCRCSEWVSRWRRDRRYYKWQLSWVPPLRLPFGPRRGTDAQSCERTLWCPPYEILNCSSSTRPDSDFWIPSRKEIYHLNLGPYICIFIHYCTGVEMCIKATWFISLELSRGQLEDVHAFRGYSVRGPEMWKLVTRKQPSVLCVSSVRESNEAHDVV